MLPNPASPPARDHRGVPRFALLLSGVLVALGAAFGCLSCPEAPPGPQVPETPGPSAVPPASQFDSAAAWRYLEEIVAFGPRCSGNRANRELQDYLAAHLTALGLEPVRETFHDATPIGQIEFTNIYVDIPASCAPTDAPAPIVVLASHFDTKRLPFEFVGANDAGSSTAVLLELARCLLEEKRDRSVTYRILFLDGEEAIRPDWEGNDNTYGSRHHVARLQESGELTRVKACVLLDMVGDKDLALTFELGSNRELLQIFFTAAERIGLARHVGAGYREINDDHLPFLAAGVPSVDLIDFEYGGKYNAYWHTEHDVLENCAPESLDAIGRIVLAGLPDLEAWVLARDN